MITRQEAYPPARAALQMARLPPAPSAVRSPPPNHPLAAQISGVATSPSLRFHRRRQRDADPCSILESGVGDPDLRYGVTRTSSPRPFHHPVRGPSCLPTPAQSTRNGGVSSLQVKFKVERGRSRRETPTAGSSVGVGRDRTCYSGPPKRRKRRTENPDADCGARDSDLHFPSPP